MAFEPLEEHISRLRQVAHCPPRITVAQVALGRYTSQRYLFVNSKSDASGLLPLSAVGRGQFGIEQVSARLARMESLDEYAARMQLPPPTLIKLDVQGYEIEVLEGASACLAQAKRVICEVSFHEFYSGQPLFHDVASYIAERGLHVFALGVDTPHRQPLQQVDVLFRNTRVPPRQTGHPSSVTR